MQWLDALYSTQDTEYVTQSMAFRMLIIDSHDGKATGASYTEIHETTPLYIAVERLNSRRGCLNRSSQLLDGSSAVVSSDIRDHRRLRCTIGGEHPHS